MMEIDIDALAEELTSAANIVTNDGYYELDTAAVAQCLDKALATTRAELAASKERERETLAVLQTAHESEAALIEQLAAAHATIYQLGENAAKAAGEYAAEVGRLREALEDTQSTLSAVRASALAAAGASDLKHIYHTCGEQMARNRAALTERTDG